MIQAMVGKGAVLGGAQCQRTGQCSCQTKSHPSKYKLIFQGLRAVSCLEEHQENSQRHNIVPRVTCVAWFQVPASKHRNARAFQQ